ncbi:HPF/RaiA family ribosome-associated protein [Sulfitobacter guttiformis]|uniref:Sigma 54 modulation/S30EA-like ribosomal protein n=1 Tax=Sulfitobacter guttiformis TaxID=74349 RepID=A0A420DRC9_9RHOB|nr:HPF/RaiA family ribosome-associated protein [Sulfitobacter guttiformis]KIN74122.1 Ribosomal subunit interface protein [Sulfitobacter guttiformis KCTC 32187]RKE96738.1 hypothetical protein C8N30_1307 [Sulfitobacter guttiformis]
MRIKISTDNSMDGSEGLANAIRDLVQNELTNLEDHISSIEVHLSNPVGGTKGETEKHCMLEARLKGQKPTVVTHTALTAEQAAKGAASKMKSSLGSILGKQGDDHQSIRGDLEG